uniref:Uncharacterized protein n=1 Tax=Chenopodium quinoa TaxID=63459 RepID=A0A803N178_CHEQI
MSHLMTVQQQKSLINFYVQHADLERNRATPSHISGWDGFDNLAAALKGKPVKVEVGPTVGAKEAEDAKSAAAKEVMPAKTAAPKEGKKAKSVAPKEVMNAKN